MRYLSLDEILELHARVVEQSGGAARVRDLPALESAASQPLQSFDGRELYPSVVGKAAALGFFLISNHPFVDGNKRVGHAALEVTLILNGFELRASVDEQERVILAVASGKLNRAELEEWVEKHARRRDA